MDLQQSKELLTLDNYRAFDALNQSTLTQVWRDITKVGVKKESTELRKGSIVDDLITQADVFYDKYEVVSVRYPDPATKNTLDSLNPLLSLVEQKEQAISLYKGFNGVVKKDDTAWSHILKGVDYFNHLRDTLSITKTIIIKDEFYECDCLANTLKYHGLTKQYFNEDAKYQVPVLFDITEFDLGISSRKDIVVCQGKILVDIINGTTAIDVKTMSDYTNTFFPKSYYKWRYDVQASFYMFGLKKAGYNIKDFKFVVGSFMSPNKPMVFVMSDDALKKGAEGFDRYGTYYKGWKQLAREYFWHKETDNWLYPKEIYEYGGVII